MSSLKNNNFIILISSCKKNTSLQNIQREIFKNCKVQYFFLIGGSPKTFLKDDVLFLKAPDTYEMLHLKIIKALKYFKAKHNILKIDDDTLVDFNNLMHYCFCFDYGGYIGNSGNSPYVYHEDKVTDKRFKSKIVSKLKYSFAYGGGYFLSKKAQNIVLKNYKASEEYYNHTKFLKGREDRMIGQTLYPFFNKINVKSCGFRLNSSSDEDCSFSAFNNSIFHPVSEQYLSLLSKKRFKEFAILSKTIIN